jgi:hypothetical protein
MVHCKTKCFAPIIILKSGSLHVKLYGKRTRQIYWDLTMFFARIVREFDNGFRPHRRKFDRIYLKSQIPGGGGWSHLELTRTSVFINFIVFIFILFSLIEWRNTSYFSSNTIQTVLVFYKNCCRVVLLTKTQENIFYNCFFLQKFRTLYFARVTFFPFFYKRTIPYNKKLTDFNRSGSTGKYPTSAVLRVGRAIARGQCSKTDRGWIFSGTALTLGQL